MPPEAQGGRQRRRRGALAAAWPASPGGRLSLSHFNPAREGNADDQVQNAQTLVSMADLPQRSGDWSVAVPIYQTPPTSSAGPSMHNLFALKGSATFTPAS
jgi:hypothetical protein